MTECLFTDPAALASVCRQRQIRRLALFGSTLKGTNRPDSDIDLLVEFDPEARPSLLTMARIEMELSELLGGGRSISARLRISAAISGMRWCRRRRYNMNTEDQVRLRHIIDALETTIRFTESRCRDDLERDEMLSGLMQYDLKQDQHPRYIMLSPYLQVC